MSLTLNNLKLSTGYRRPAKVMGRGNASGKGMSCGRGTKGQKCRNGGTVGILRRSLRELLFKAPKYKGVKPGVNNVAVVNLSDIDKTFKEKEQVTARILFRRGLISRLSEVKILGDGEIKKALKFSKTLTFSKSAILKIEKAGGKIE